MPAESIILSPSRINGWLECEHYLRLYATQRGSFSRAADAEAIEDTLEKAWSIERSDAISLVESGEVQINENQATLGQSVQIESDRISIAGNLLTPRPKQFMDLLTERGNRHEADCLQAFKQSSKVGEVFQRPDWDRSGGETFNEYLARFDSENPLDGNNEVVFQMPLLVSDEIRGIADFLIAVQGEDDGYEPVDSKLARSGAKASHILQLLFYAEAISIREGTGLPKNLHVMLGSRSPEDFISELWGNESEDGTPEETGSREVPQSHFETRKYWWYWQRLRNQLRKSVKEAIELGTKDSIPDKNGFCGFCEYKEECDKEWKQTDSLVLLAGANTADRKKLREAGITTVTGLAILDKKTFGDGVQDLSDLTLADFEEAKTIYRSEGHQDITELNHDFSGILPDINRDRLVKFWRQARLQFTTYFQASTGGGIYTHFFSRQEMEVKEIEGQKKSETHKTILTIPAPVQGDIYLDFEGHPFWDAEEGGLIFLFGYIHLGNSSQRREEQLANTDDQLNDWHFVDLWAHDKKEESNQAKRLVNDLYARWLADRSMHIYHYNHTEQTLLQGIVGPGSSAGSIVSFLSQLGIVLEPFSIEEARLKELMTHDVFVDLLPIARNSFQAGLPSYSLKKVEKLAGYERQAEDVQKGAGAVMLYELIANKERFHVSEDEATEYMEAINAYNLDDVQATRYVHEWLWSQHCEESERAGSDFKLEEIGENDSKDVDREAELAIQRQISDFILERRANE